MPRDRSIKKVLVIGSGPIVIGQAAEFDYAGAQACRVLREEGINTVLLNSNPATIMTDGDFADEIYLEPLNEETVRRIIEKERPDSLLAGLGGQTALTLAMRLSKEGFLSKMGVRLIGTNADAIDKAEDRELFKETMLEIGEPIIPSGTANTVEESIEIAGRIGYPVIIRPAFTLGGSGGGKAYNEEELRTAAAVGLDASPIRQILVEKYIYGYKEIEFETMRDSVGNVIAVCSMENVDPVGVHTGDSIVVSPALTLSDKEYQMLRSASLNIVSALGIVGGCNCQFALDPDSFGYAVIEVNPRVSRSSALASKATGYPIAKVSTKIALGYTLDEIKNEITGKTCACFEPALDYVVVKFPKWPFDKFPLSDRTLGTQMKATGEVMAIDRSFEGALMKAVRGAEIGAETLNLPSHDDAPIRERLARCDDHRIFTVFEALKRGVSPEEIHDITKIDMFFIEKLRGLADFESEIKGNLSTTLYKKGKKLGYTDKSLAALSGCALPCKLRPSYKMVDTCGAEFDALTPYFYSSYEEECESEDFRRSGKDVIVVLGSGPIRIGQGIEFDYSSVHCVSTLKKLGYDVVIINNNPETVSTDYDTADRLYFEPVTAEDVMNVIALERPVGVVVAFGGQTAIKLAGTLDRAGIKILGTSAEGIDIAEDRERFDELLGTLGVKRPRGMAATGMEEALSAAESLGYPVLLRPSYVIGGQNMQICHSSDEVRRYMDRILEGGIDNPVLVDKYMMGPELEVDVISDGTDVLIPGVMQHIERAGIHSGDSIAVYPPYSLNDKMMAEIVSTSERLALSLGTKGLVNIQYLIYRGELYVIEVNPRASRTIPYISKVTGVPMVALASRVMVGERVRDLGYGTGLYRTPPYYAVKVPVFSFEKLTDVNSRLGPEMKSTGEVLGIGRTLNEALFKGLSAAGFTVSGHSKKESGVFISVDEHDFGDLFTLAKKLDDAKMHIYATKDTAAVIRSLGIEVCEVPGMTDRDGTFRLLESGKISYIVYTGALFDSTYDDYIDLHRKAVREGIVCLTSLDTANALADIVLARFTLSNTELVDINHMRREHSVLHFSKMHGTGNDYIFFDNSDGAIESPESLCVTICDRSRGIGGCGIVLIEPSCKADAKMRIFNGDGSEGEMAGNSIRCTAKYLWDNGICKKERMRIETASGIKEINISTRNGKVYFAGVDMGKASFRPKDIPVKWDAESALDMEAEIGGCKYRVSCVSVGNPHCVVFCDYPDSLDLEKIGPLFENADIFPDRVNTEFVRVVNPVTLRMRVYERGNGETAACGTGACAAVAAAVETGRCLAGTDVTVKLRGGDLTVNYTRERIILSGDANLVYTGEFEY